MSTARLKTDANVRTTPTIKATTFFKRIPKRSWVSVLHKDVNNKVVRIRMKDGNEGWIDARYLGVHR